MNHPEHLKYAKTHEWVEKDGDKAKIGLTDFAQSEMGEIVFANLPEVGDSVTAGESLGDVESVKAVSDVYSPLSGTVTAVNEALLDNPGLINEQPYDAWLIEVSEITDTEELLSAMDYVAHCEEESK